MFDITKFIQLKNTQQKKHYLIIKSSLLFIFLVVSILFVKEVIFPTQTFNFNSSIDSLANTISKPYETNTGTAFHIFSENESNEITLTITLPKDSPDLPKDTELLIKKSYLAFLSPINPKKYTNHITDIYNMDNKNYIEQDSELHEITTENILNSYLFKKVIFLTRNENSFAINISDEPMGFSTATLISSKNSIYITDENQKHPFQDERAVKQLGYNFDNVIEATSKERSYHKNAKLFTTKSSHPFGTLFYTTDGDRIFVYDNELLNKIPTTKLAKQHSISVQEASKTTTASCILKKTLKPRQYDCTTTLENITEFNGNTYQLILKDSPNTKIETSTIKLFTTPNKQSITQRIDSIKRKLNTNYDN